MLLIHPPVAKPCEPPAGIARLCGVLQSQGIACRALDANLEGLLWLLAQPHGATDTWSRRAGRNLNANLAALRTAETYCSPDRYSRAVKDVNRLLTVAGNAYDALVGLADFQHGTLSPLRSADLIRAAEQPEQNPFYPYFDSRLQGILAADGVPDRVVGFSLNYLSQAICTFAMIGSVRERFPDVKIVLGGGLVTSWLQRPGWCNPFGGLVDLLVSGPGEAPLLALLGAGTPPSRPAAPDYGQLPVQDYLSPGFILPYSAAGGCYWNQCSFCPEKAEGNRYAPLPVGRVREEVHSLIDLTRPALVHLLDNAISPALLHSLAEHPLRVPWYGFARFGPELVDSDFCMALRRSGCVMLKLGLESGDQGVLDKLNKGIELGMASRVLANLHRAGIKVYLYLLFGTPAESEAEARRTMAFVVRHGASIDFLNLAVFNMPAYGEEAGSYEVVPFYEGDLSLYTSFRHPRGWDRKQVRGFLNNEFKREPVVASIVRRDPPIFTSNHAPFFPGRD